MRGVKGKKREKRRRMHKLVPTTGGEDSVRVCEIVGGGGAAEGYQVGGPGIGAEIVAIAVEDDEKRRGDWSGLVHGIQMGGQHQPERNPLMLIDRVVNGVCCLGGNSKLWAYGKGKALSRGCVTMSNLTSASGEASISSGKRGDANTVQQLTASTAANTSSNTSAQQPAMKRKRSLPGTPGKHFYDFVNPDAEVIALSPKTLMTTNRFVCEICNKGFQRDQNLQLHRRGHNLPWKLKQRTSKEIRKRVYICPEQSCVHHDPARALGDLTGVKKHFCRKHGEKKWKCDKCSKRYAVQSDWKAHSKTCGTREYRCDCGTLFSRRDSFITHRAFCDALAEESARVSAGITVGGGQMPSHPLGVGQAGGPMSVMSALPSSPGSSSMFRAGGGPMDAQFSFSLRPSHGTNNISSRMGIPESGLSLVNHRPWEQPNNNTSASRPRLSLWLGNGPGTPGSATDQIMGNSHLQTGGQMNSMDVNPSAFFTQSPKTMQGMLGLSDYDDSQGAKGANLSGLLPMSSSNPGALYSNLLTSGAPQLPAMNASSGIQSSGISGNTGFGVTNWTDRSAPGLAAARLSLSTSAGLTRSSSSGNNNNNNSNNINDNGSLAPGLYNNNDNSQQQTYIAQMSATALLQKAAQMGATASNSVLFGGFGSESSTVGLGLSWQGSNPDQQRGPAGMAGMVMSGLDHNSHPFMKGGMPDNISSTNSLGLPQSSFNGSTRSPEHAGLQDLMNSLSAGAGGFFGSAVPNSMQSTFGCNVGDTANFSGMINMPGNATSDNNQRIPAVKNDNIGSVLRGPQPSMAGGSQKLMQGRSIQLPAGLRAEEGGDGLTRDFLGVGGASGMVGGLGRPISQRDHLANIASLGSGIHDLVSYNSSQRENSQSVGANGLPPTKSWDAS
eukprot:Gb_35984 [translate_table: standard]